MSSNTYEANLGLFRKLVETNPAIELKGVTMPYTSCNGHMFSYFEKYGSFDLGFRKKREKNFLRNIKRLCWYPMGLSKRNLC